MFNLFKEKKGLKKWSLLSTFLSFVILVLVLGCEAQKDPGFTSIVKEVLGCHHFEGKQSILYRLKWRPVEIGMEIRFNNIILTGKEGEVTYRMKKDIYRDSLMKTYMKNFLDKEYLFFTVGPRTLHVSKYFPEAYKISEEEKIGTVVDIKGKAIISCDERIKNFSPILPHLTITIIPDEKDALIVRDNKGDYMAFSKGYGLWSPDDKDSPLIGISIIDYSEVKRDKQGVLIIEVIPRSPADKAGLKRGDVILSVNKVKIKGTEEFIKTIQNITFEKKFLVEVLRNGETKEVIIRIDGS